MTKGYTTIFMSSEQEGNGTAQIVKKLKTVCVEGRLCTYILAVARAD